MRSFASKARINRQHIKGYFTSEGAPLQQAYIIFLFGSSKQLQYSIITVPIFKRNRSSASFQWFILLTKYPRFHCFFKWYNCSYNGLKLIVFLIISKRFRGRTRKPPLSCGVFHTSENPIRGPAPLSMTLMFQYVTRKLWMITPCLSAVTRLWLRTHSPPPPHLMLGEQCWLV